MRSSLPVARHAADLSQPCAPPVGLSRRHPQPRGRKPARRREIPWILRAIPRASKLLICGLFQKSRVLAQDGVLAGHGDSYSTVARPHARELAGPDPSVLSRANQSPARRTRYRA